MVNTNIQFPGIRQIGIFLTSLALMMFEVHLIRLFSVLMYHHLAFFVLAISLFGIGVGGLYAHLLREIAVKRGWGTTWVYYLPLLLTLAITVALVFLLFSPLGLTSEGTQMPQLRWVFVAFIVCSLPFFIGSMYISSLFAIFPTHTNVLYFFDLAGGSLGCILALLSLHVFGAIHGTLFVALLSALAVFFQGLYQSVYYRAAVGGLLVLLSVCVLAAMVGFFQLRGERFANLLYAKWNYYSYITVQDELKWQGWRPSRNYEGPYPRHRRIYQDGRAPAFIVEFDGDYDKVQYLKWDLTALPFYTAMPKKALIVGAGGGRDILTAKLFGTLFIRGVELNPTIVSAMQREFREYSGNVYGMEGVDIITENARTFLLRDQEQYDLVFTSLADTQTASKQGAQILSENHLYTVEAFEAYYDRLTDEGFCTIVCGLAEDMLRHVATVATALENKGIEDPARHMIVVITDTYGRISNGLFLAFSKRPISEAVVNNVSTVTAALGYHMVWPEQPDSPREYTQRVAALSRKTTRPQILAEMKMDFSPLWDDRPYLFYNVKPASFLKALVAPFSISARHGHDTQVFYVLLDLFAVVGVCVFLLMLLPLVLFRHGELRGRGMRRLTFLAIFLLLGIGFMLVEISLLQFFFLLLGNPSLTFAVVLGVLLFCTGLGSFIARCFTTESLHKALPLWAIVVILIQLASLIAMSPIQQAVQSASLPLRLGAVLAISACWAIPMGFMFPTAMRLVDRERLQMVCWAWGMNGLGSVFGIVGATVLATNFGIRNTFLIGIACYGGVCLIASMVCFATIQGQDKTKQSVLPR